MADKILDAKGLSCPMPVLKANKMLQGMAKGEVLEVQATDQSSVADFEAFCQSTKRKMVAKSEANGVYTFRIEN